MSFKSTKRSWRSTTSRNQCAGKSRRETFWRKSANIQKLVFSCGELTVRPESEEGSCSYPQGRNASFDRKHFVHEFQERSIQSLEL